MKNTSCILTVVKNEQEYLDEWIKYHLDLGIDHIFIFEDIDSDSHKEIFERDFQNAVNGPKIKFVCNSVEGWSKELEDALWKIVQP